MTKKKNFYNPALAKHFDPADERKVAIVTGGNSGIGWYTALHLYLHGYIVYIAGRNDQKVEGAIEDISSEAASRIKSYSHREAKHKPLGELRSLHLDCCDLRSVERCAEDFMKNESRLDLLINNAGIMAVPFEMTKDGYEIQYQVNLVAPFLFTAKLLPIMKHSEMEGSAPRVLILSSIGHKVSAKYRDPTLTLKKFPDAMYTWVRYGNAKRGAIEFMQKFARNHPDILAFSVHPGVITDTRLYDNCAKIPALGSVFKFIFQIAGKVIGVSREDGALATLRAALDPKLGKEQSGSYLVTGGPIKAPSRVSRKDSNINRTWDYLQSSLVRNGFLNVTETI